MRRCYRDSRANSLCNTDRWARGSVVIKCNYASSGAISWPGSVFVVGENTAWVTASLRPRSFAANTSAAGSDIKQRSLGGCAMHIYAYVSLCFSEVISDASKVLFKNPRQRALKFMLVVTIILNPIIFFLIWFWNNLSLSKSENRVFVVLFVYTCATFHVKCEQEFMRHLV